jgi:hypothetical protein
MRPTRPHGYDPAVVQPPARTCPQALSRRDSSKSRWEGANPNIRYTVAEFLQDQEQLISGEELHDDRPHVVERPDGRMVVVHTRWLRDTVDSANRPLAVFVERYGRGADVSRHSRFRLVLEFLDDWRDQISRSGLGFEGEPMEVREELVDFLLSYSVDPDHPEIPRGALTRLLEELSTRWT